MTDAPARKPIRRRKKPEVINYDRIIACVHNLAARITCLENAVIQLQQIVTAA
jgi:hypothetical protein